MGIYVIEYVTHTIPRICITCCTHSVTTFYPLRVYIQKMYLRGKVVKRYTPIAFIYNVRDILLTHGGMHCL